VFTSLPFQQFRIFFLAGEGHASVRGQVLRHDDVVDRRRSPMRREVPGLNHERTKIGPGKSPNLFLY
jgi:hypothetical protein